MLKNVAIPLMLTASQAEGAPAGTAEYWTKILKAAKVSDVIKGDEANIPDFVAPSDACLGKSATTGLTGDLAKADTALFTQNGKLVTAQGKITTAQAALDKTNAKDGDWFKVNDALVKARAAVTTANAEADVKKARDAYIKQVETTAAAADSLAAALKATKTYLTVESLLQEDARLAQDYTTKKAVSDVQTKAAAEAVRKDLYCKLGNHPLKEDFSTRAADTLTAKTWDKIVGIDLASATGCVAGGVTYKLKGSVADGDTRTATYNRQYWDAKLKTGGTTQKYKSDTGTKNLYGSTWKIVADAATGDVRTATGVAAYYLGYKRSREWQQMSRTRELAFWNSIEAARAAALAEATGQNTAGWYCGKSTAANQDLIGPNGCIQSAQARMDQNLAAMKGVAAATNQNKVMGLRELLMPATRAAENAPSDGLASTKDFTDGSRVERPMGKWTAWGSKADKGKLDAWVAINNKDKATTGTNDTTNSNVHRWWSLAREITAGMDTWYTTMAFASGDANKPAADDIAETTTTGAYGTTGEKAAVKTGDFSCTKHANNGGGWTAEATLADAGLCANKCVQQNRVALGLGNIKDGDLDKDVYGFKSSIVPDFGMDQTDADLESVTNGKYMLCHGYSFLNAGTKCSIGLIAVADTITPVAAASSGNAGQCHNLTNAKALGEAKAKVRKQWKAAMVTNYDGYLMDATSGLGAIKKIEEAWMEAWYEGQFWTKMAAKLTAALSKDYFPVGTTNTIAAEIATISTAGKGVTGPASTIALVVSDVVKTMATEADTEYKTALTTLNTIRGNVDSAERDIIWLGMRILAADAQVTSLGLTKPKNLADGVEIVEVTNNAKTALDGFRATAAATDLTGKALAAHKTWQTAVRNLAGESTKYATARTNAKAGATAKPKGIEGLETAVKTAVTNFNKENVKQLVGGTLAKALKDAKDGVTKEQAEYNKLQQACYTAAFDAYAATLKKALTDRKDNLVKIKALLEKNQKDKPAFGKENSRCEKALSNGTLRPKRELDATKPGAVCEKDLCCAAAKVPLASGVATTAGKGSAKAGFRIIETCQKAASSGTGKYSYTPPRAPLATANPTPTTHTYTCIEGAKHLAAAATAAATALYMLA